MKADRRIRKLFSGKENPWAVDRREFMKQLGTGIIVAASVSKPVLAGNMTAEEEEDFNAYLRIGEDGRVTCLTGKIEMGQGPITSLPMEMADELDVALDQVDIIMGDTDLCPWDEGTYGSLSTRVFGEIMRPACAEARAVLIGMASEKLSVPVDRLTVSKGVISDTLDPSVNVSYGELAEGKRINRTVKVKPPVKDHTRFKIMGTPELRSDSEEKVTGRAKYAGDIQLPGMLYARIARPPEFRARLVSVDTSRAESMDGVQTVRDGDLVAVLHELPDMADIAVTRVRAQWDIEKMDVDTESIFSYLLSKGKRSREVQMEGNLETGKKAAVHQFQQEYHDGYVAHAPIENHTATALMEDGELTLWASSQTPFPAREQVAEALDIPESKIHLKQVFLGGGFGGKIYNEQVVEAARIARKMEGTPIQLVWSRREEFMYDHLRPAAVVRVDSGIDDEGKIAYWDYNVYFAGARGSEHHYDIPHTRSLSWSGERGDNVHPFYTGAWRAPANNTNVFARESHIDIMAAKAGIDPLDFRLKNTKDEKLAAALKMAADKFGYTPAPAPSGRGYGIACGYDVGTYIAALAEVEVNRETGHVQVKRMTACQHMGMIVNPQGARIQCEGGLLMGLGYALGEEIEFEGSRMLTRNFDTYRFTHFSWTPEVDVHFIDAQADPPRAGGEPGVIPVGGMLANAIFDACGARVHRMPMTGERVLQAIRSVET